MSKEDEFLDIADNQDQFTAHKKRQKKGVIKSGQNHVKGTLLLEPKDEDGGDGVEFFQPIYEGDLIVGVIHKCTCGKTAELRFQYSPINQA